MIGFLGRGASVVLFAVLSAGVVSAAGLKPQERILYAFTGGSDGAFPEAGLVADANGNLYGTTQHGGLPSACFIGCGTVFKLTPQGSGYVESIVYRFGGGKDGAYPFSALSFYGDTIYGTTNGGGYAGSSCLEGCGTVFKLTPNASGYIESIVYRFRGGSDGQGPAAPLFIDRNGALYGTTRSGGAAGYGTVFLLTPGRTVYTETILYNFQGGHDGAYPSSGVTVNLGLLFGETEAGGAGSCRCGTVYNLRPTRSGWRERVSYSFTGTGGDGSFPSWGLVADPSHQLYGTTQSGGSSCPSRGGCGTVFRLTAQVSGFTETIIHSFGSAPRGIAPNGGLIMNEHGNLFGTTQSGGRQAGCEACGVVYELVPFGSTFRERLLYSFGKPGDGDSPVGLLLKVKNTVYGTTNLGGAGFGTVFSVTF